MASVVFMVLPFMKGFAVATAFDVSVLTVQRIPPSAVLPSLCIFHSLGLVGFVSEMRQWERNLVQAHQRGELTAGGLMEGVTTVSFWSGVTAPALVALPVAIRRRLMKR